MAGNSFQALTFLWNMRVRKATDVIILICLQMAVNDHNAPLFSELLRGSEEAWLAARLMLTEDRE